MAVDSLGGGKRSLGSLWTDQRSRQIIIQALTVGLLGAFIAYIVHNTATNLAERGIATGFGFLEDPAGYDVAFSLIPFDRTATHGRIFVIGLLNTLLVAFLGIIFATILGFVMGVLRLSRNWLVNRVVYGYIEIVRNLPVLLQILFWYGILLNLPTTRNAVQIGDSIFLSNRGIVAPAPVTEPGFEAIPIVFLLGVIATIVLSRWARKRQEATGQIFPVLWAGLGLILGLPILAALVTGMPWTWDVPALKGFNFQGGFVIKPEFVCLWLALTVYTGAFIAEIVRAGIQSVSHGQTEAAAALGLRSNWIMRLILIPQALRVIVPPLTSQYLNLTKNSSLAVAVGYPDLVATFGGTTLNQTGQAVEVIAITMAVYLLISLGISAIMNWYNRRIKLVER